MKSIKTIVALLAIAAFTGCAGDHGVGSGQDTAQNSYQVSADNAKSDTSEVITHTGDTQSGDYSANGGAGLVKPDTSAKK